MDFSVTRADPGSSARCGRLSLPHGEVETPAFMPVGTQATVKAMTPRQIEETGARIVLANTYHLSLRPGADVIRDAGGLHTFMAWPHPILTDSGGFQVFSLSEHNRVDDDGVLFRSYYDGSEVHLTPEKSVEIQNDLGADIIMAFDECPPHDASPAQVEQAVQRTTNWARRSLDAHDRDDQALFGIVQGGTHDELRRRSAEEVGAMGFAGFAIGGVSVGESPAEMRRVVELTAPRLPEDRPRYVMGVGRPEDLVDMVGAGIDLFDCVLPTRNARNATLFTRSGTVRIKGAVHARDPRALEEGCPCYTCTHFSRGYLRHLYHQNEILAAVLGTLHNLSFYQNLMADLRRAIGAGRYVDFRSAFHTVLKGA